MTNTMPFGEVLEAADHLTPEEQAELIAILHRRLAEAARMRVVSDVNDSRRDFAAGKCSPMTPDEIMREILK